jgi:hypothetical protein
MYELECLAPACVVIPSHFCVAGMGFPTGMPWLTTVTKVTIEENITPNVMVKWFTLLLRI